MMPTKKEKFLAKFPSSGDDRYYDITGAPISLAEWAWRFEDKNYQVIQHTRKRGILVSTVWLGIDHAFHFREDRSPVIFETMIFGGRFSDNGEWQMRYATLEAAIAGHRYACEVAFGWRSRLIEALRVWKPDIPMPPIGRWAPPKSWARPWDRDYPEEL